MLIPCAVEYIGDVVDCVDIVNSSPPSTVPAGQEQPMTPNMEVDEGTQPTDHEAEQWVARDAEVDVAMDVLIGPVRHARQQSRRRAT